jgi:hypothetical protein
MKGSGINQLGHAQLLYSSEALKIRMLHDFKYKVRRNSDETVNGVVEYFAFVSQNLFLEVLSRIILYEHHLCATKFLKKAEIGAYWSGINI